MLNNKKMLIMKTNLKIEKFIQATKSLMKCLELMKRRNEHISETTYINNIYTDAVKTIWI